MRRSMSVIAAASAIVLAMGLLASSAFAGGSVAVSATTPWVFGGAFVTAGATYDVTARGQVMTAPIPGFHVPGVFKSASGPAGQPDQPCLAAYENTLNGQCALEGANFGALIGVVIDGNTGMAVGAPFLIGDAPSFAAPAEGFLFLAANDLNLTYWDNNGQFSVTVTGP